MQGDDAAVALDPMEAGARRQVPAAAADLSGLYWLASERALGMDRIPMTAKFHQGDWRPVFRRARGDD
jgi:hypothetical protein